MKPEGKYLMLTGKKESRRKPPTAATATRRTRLRKTKSPMGILSRQTNPGRVKMGIRTRILNPMGIMPSRPTLRKSRKLRIG